jgi:general stress protein YciG
MDTKQLYIPTVQEAGRLGGLTVFRKRGKAFFAKIGQSGQVVMRQKYPNMAREWGRRGGRPRKNNLDDMGK